MRAAGAAALGVLLRTVCVICILCLISSPFLLYQRYCVLASLLCPDCGRALLILRPNERGSISKTCGDFEKSGEWLDSSESGTEGRALVRAVSIPRRRNLNTRRYSTSES